MHATIAGVALGLLTPARPYRGRDVLGELEHRLHPVSAYLVVPLFAVANAGLALSAGAVREALAARLTWAVAVGLVVGKTLGIALTTLAASRLRVAALPADLPGRAVWGLAALAGIGFTVSLFIADLAFDDPTLVDHAKVGILLGSALSAGLGVGLVLLIGRSTPRARKF